jgi:hypothetical protein
VGWVVGHYNEVQLTLFLAGFTEYSVDVGAVRKLSAEIDPPRYLTESVSLIFASNFIANHCGNDSAVWNVQLKMY